MKTINIKGKNYVTVAERLKYFRENFLGWALETEWIIIEEEKAACRVVIKDPEGVIKSTGTAMELRDERSSLVNKTSHVENCETSAVGRALGNLGIGLDGDVASAEEVELAKKQQLIISINNMIDDENRGQYEEEYKLSELGMMSIEELEILENQLKVNQKGILCKLISKLAQGEEMRNILKTYKTKDIGILDLKDLITIHNQLVAYGKKCSKEEIEKVTNTCEMLGIDIEEYVSVNFQKTSKDLVKREYRDMMKNLKK